jgi:hypothetical protein
MIDVVELAVGVMKKRGHAVKRHDTWLEHPDSGLVIRPQLLESHPSSSVVRSVSVVTTSHPRLAPDGVFEYQHAVGETLSDAFCDGFDQWAQLDFIVFLDALRDAPEQCAGIGFNFQRTDGPALSRRVVLGPVGHAVAHPEVPPLDDGHPFCSCCFVTNTFEAFRPLLETDGFYGIRLFAARREDGSAQADCRVNGEDWDEGKQALLGYVDTWPQAGFEFRKQYVVLQTVNSSHRD